MEKVLSHPRARECICDAKERPECREKSSMENVPRDRRLDLIREESRRLAIDPTIMSHPQTFFANLQRGFPCSVVNTL